MARLRIQPHGRLQEWVAHEQGYFRDEGLEYDFAFVAPDERSKDSANPVLTGAYELYAEGRGSKGTNACDVSSACHWAVNQASASQLGRMWGRAYSITSAGIYVPPESEIRHPQDLASVPVAVGYHSGSHFATLQSLEVFLPASQIELAFIGRPMARLDAALERKVEAVSAWGLAQYVLEQRGFRRILDTTFIVGFLFPAAVADEDIDKFMNALRRAQMAIDVRPELHKHHYLKELPERFHGTVDVRRFGPGERIVFLPYTKEMYEQTG
ncbi:MAG TPA: hypothetical protein VEK15_01885, partial [Vicinamibacteria bacterium]|nr:hypothetical protein [Vicinamibacteria bacterium]